MMLLPRLVISLGSLAKLSLVMLASCATSAGGTANDAELLPITATPIDDAMSAVASPVAVERRFHHEVKARARGDGE